MHPVLASPPAFLWSMLCSRRSSGLASSLYNTFLIFCKSDAHMEARMQRFDQGVVTMIYLGVSTKRYSAACRYFGCCPISGSSETNQLLLSTVAVHVSHEIGGSLRLPLNLGPIELSCSQFGPGDEPSVGGVMSRVLRRPPLSQDRGGHCGALAGRSTGAPVVSVFPLAVGRLKLVGCKESKIPFVGEVGLPALTPQELRFPCTHFRFFVLYVHSCGLAGYLVLIL
jgi:hypothetical protein